MKIYGIIEDGGDGSASIGWYSKEDADYVLSNDYEYFDYVQMNEGEPAQVIDIPYGFTPLDLGIRMSVVVRSEEEEEDV